MMMAGSWDAKLSMRWRVQVAPLRWLSYVSYFRYTIDGLLQLQYAARDDGCGLFADVTPQARAAAQAGRAPLPTGRELCNGVLQHQVAPSCTVLSLIFG